MCVDETIPEIAGAAEKLAKQSEALVPCKLVSNDEQALETAKETQGAVLLVQLWKTRHTDLNRQLEIFARMDQKVLGVVVVK